MQGAGEWAMPSHFDCRVWGLLKKIPCGRVVTYKQVALALGKPNAARAVGNACRRNPFAPDVPCHRVVKSDGSLGGYALGAGKKAALLESEGVRVANGRIVDFKKAGWRF
jgi:O-6-methylguanine DNA methyltransferase